MRFYVPLLLSLGAANAQSCQMTASLSGTCKSESLCQTGFTASGLCPGAADIKCCAVYSCFDNSGVKGLCKNTAKCTGTKTAGKCPGPSDVQCCTESGGGGSLPTRFPTRYPTSPTGGVSLPTRYPTRYPTKFPTPAGSPPTRTPVVPSTNPPTPRPTAGGSGPQVWTNTVQQQANARGCSTVVVAGISKQLVDEVNCLRPGSFSSLSGLSRIALGDAAAKVPFAQTGLVQALQRAVAARGSTVTINSALRSIAQQLLLFKWQGSCGITIAASPGNSNHNGGAAIDINDASGWNSFLSAQGFRYYGPGDPVHFDYTAGVDVRSLSVKAFQVLWNTNNPGDQIATDGQYGPATEARLLKSPANGFPKGATCGSTPSGGGGGGSTPTPPPTPQKCNVNGVAGVCINQVSCSGVVTSGLCPGAADIKCCTPRPVGPPAPTPGGTSGGGSCAKASASSLNIGNNGLGLIKHFEGLYLQCYKDSKGIWTIGYGHACHVNSNDGSGCLSGNACSGTLTVAQATTILRKDVAAFVTCVRNAVKVPVTQNQFDAMVAFSFNIGCGGFQESTLLAKLNSNALTTKEALYQFSRWHSGCLEGLKRRRYAEGMLFGSCSSNFGCNDSGCAPSSSYLSCGSSCEFCSRCGGCSGSFVGFPTPSPGTVDISPASHPRNSVPLALFSIAAVVVAVGII